jgi:amino acid adenylation domain-containing protein
MDVLRKENIEDILPLSSTQEGMLFHYISGPSSTNYHEQIRLVLTGNIKVEIMQKAWNFVVESNEILRSVFRWENLEKPLQIVLKTYKSTINFYDFTENIDINNSVDNVIKSDFSKKIDISSENVRLYLCKLNDYFEMIISNHHILYDGWSNGIILKELMYAYTCFYKGEEPNKREKSKLKEHIKVIAKQDKGMQKDYWSHFFQGYNLVLDKKENKGIVKDFTYKISEELSQNVKAYAKERKVSYASVLYSVWGILLHKYRGVNDFIFGTTVSGRGSRIVGVEDIVGMFINTIPLRVTANDEDTLLDVITKVSTELKQREEHENTPLLEIKEYSQIESKDEIFDSIVVIENYPLEKELMNNCLLKIKSYSTVVRTNYDLTLGIMLFKGLELNFHYSINVYSDNIIRVMGKQYEKLLKAVLEDDSLSYSKLDIISEQDKNLFIHQLNKTNLEYPKNKTLTKIFSEQVSRNPENVAIVYKDKTLTYAELDDKSNQLANILREKGITSNVIVALLVDRSLDMIIGILAVLKAGGAYLPIDIKYPNDRIKYMLDDSNAAVVLTQRDFLENITFNGPIINIDEERVLLNNQYIEEDLNSPNDLAYIIYTSGSTGKPKGALITHKNVVNLVYGLSDTIYSRYSGRLNVALIASYVFDASVQQIFTALLLGHSLHIIPTNVRLNGNELISYLNKNSIDICDGTPVHIGIINEANCEHKRINVKQFIIGGDVLLSNVVKELYNKFPEDNFCVANIYGPTECCVDTTIYQIERNNIRELIRIPIGKPLPNTSVYLLDKYENLVPIGGVGEICIAGDGVGDGYLNSPKLTEKRFFKNPYVVNQKLYKTGDLGRWLSDGNIDFLGRIDNQVKIRGHRIELGEIENEILNYNKNSNFNKQIKYCKRCLLPSSYPSIHFDDEGICNICNNYDKYKSKANDFFMNSEDFEKIINRAKKSKTSEYDCLLLYSGGKDSSYVLYRLVEMGLKVLTFTFDNGYISDTAFKNIRRVTSELGVDHIVSKVDNMDKIFFESLKEECTVCTGCFKALTAISTKIAFEKGINVIITGLSRGQIFDTKLQELYNQGIFDVEEIEEKLLLFRKMYHAVKDETTKLLNVKLDDEQAFNKTYFIDFYRYENKSSREILNYLKKKDDFWNMPTDTGFCSTNCFINDVGIYVHIKNKKFHNYASPLAWDYRLGLATQQEVIDGLKEEFDIERINNILQKIGYQNINIDERIIQSVAVIDREDKSGNKYLCAYYTSNSKISNLEIKRYLSQILPSYMIPSYFMRIDELPLNNNLKLDKKKLPVINFSEIIEEYEAPKKEIETKLVKIWCSILEIEKIGCNDNFFEIGGHSLKAMTLINKIQKELNKKISLEEFFEAPTIKELANIIENKETDYYTQIPKVERKSLI